MLLSGSAYACPGLDLRDGWIRQAPPRSTVMAGYARLANKGAEPIVVDKAGSPAFGAAELHRTVVENGISRMLRDQPLAIAPGAQAVLEPGGWHLMLFRPARELKAGDQVPVRLECRGAAQSFTFTVRAE